MDECVLCGALAQGCFNRRAIHPHHARPSGAGRRAFPSAAAHDWPGEEDKAEQDKSRAKTPWSVPCCGQDRTGHNDQAVAQQVLSWPTYTTQH